MAVEATIATQESNVQSDEWAGGKSPFQVGYGKIMMWYFLISDTFTFASFLIAYGAIRFANMELWPNPSQVFKSIPIHGLDTIHAPLVFVSIMTFILILSSVTMVRAVQEGFMMNKWGVVKWLIPTIVGGIAFLACQYLEWTHLFHEGMVISGGQAWNPFSALGHYHDTGVWGPQGFAMFFFVITGFHGLHVLIGVVLNIWLAIETAKGRFEKVGHYEMVEKIGLYWHFVDLVWVFVFLCYYLL